MSERNTKLAELQSIVKRCRTILNSDADSLEKAKARKSLAEANNEITVLKAEIEIAENGGGFNGK